MMYAAIVAMQPPDRMSQREERMFCAATQMSRPAVRTAYAGGAASQIAALMSQMLG